MADFSASHHPHMFGRRRQSAITNLEGTVHFAAPEQPRVEGTLADKAQEYDRALRQSQYAAATRRRAPGGSVLGMSTLSVGPSSSSIFGGVAMAQTAILGDSQGSIRVSTGLKGAGRTSGVEGGETRIPLEDLAPDGGVGSGLGESYVDGGKRVMAYGGEEEEDDGLEDVGVLGLLAQIYGRREGAGAVI